MTRTHTASALQSTFRALGLSVNRAAALARMDQSTLNKIVRGDTQIGLERLRRIALALQVDETTWRTWLAAKVEDGAPHELLSAPLQAPPRARVPGGGASAPSFRAPARAAARMPVPHVPDAQDRDERLATRRLEAGAAEALHALVREAVREVVAPLEARLRRIEGVRGVREALEAEERLSKEGAERGEYRYTRRGLARWNTRFILSTSGRVMRRASRSHGHAVLSRGMRRPA